MAIALARRGGTKCRKNSPQVTVFSQSGEATCCERGGKTYLRTRPPQILARGGSPPRNPPASETKTNAHDYPNTRPQGLPATPARSPVAAPRREIPRNRNENKRTRLPEYSPAGAPCLACAGSAPSGSATLTETTRAVRFTFSRKYVIIRKTQRQKRKTKSAE